MTKKTGGDVGRPPGITQKTRQLQELWRAADKSPVILECGNLQTANRLRVQLYNSVKMVKENPMLDPELAGIVDRLSIHMTGEGKTTLEIKPSSSAAIVEAALRALGREDVLESPAEVVKREAEESLKRIQGMLGGEGDREGNASGNGETPAPRVTPYYTR